MSDSFVINFMKVIQAQTGADRALAYDPALQLLDAVLTGDEDTSLDAISLAHLKEAAATGETTLSNNVITDPAEAPNTNTHLINLRMILVVPLGKFGTVFLDQSVRNGVFDNATVQKISNFAQRLIAEGRADLSIAQLSALYHEIDDVTSS